MKNEILILEKKVKDINKRIDKLYEDKYNGLFEDEDFTRLYSKQIENRKQAEERIKQVKELEEKEDSSIDINKLVNDFVNMKEITRTMIVSLVHKIEISESKEITMYGSYNTSGRIDKTELKKNLDNVEGIDQSTTDIKSLPATVVVDGYEVTITGKLEIPIAKPGEIVTGEIVTGANKEYEKNGTAVIPVGFAIVPNLDDVSE